MKLSGKFGSRSGVTLVELLVVMLIVVILAVSLVPFLRDYIVKARYTAEGVPVVGDLRTKIELYRYEPGGLPGLGSTVVPAAAVSDLATAILGASGTGRIHTWAETTTATDPVAKFAQGVAIPSGAGLAVTLAPEILNATEAVHLGNHVQVDTQHLTGRRMRPNHLFYTGYQTSNATSYAYAVGVFGDGKPGLLNAGSGYAVLEVYNAALNVKVVAEWSRFLERGSSGQQIVMVSANESAPADLTAAGGRQHLDAGQCHVGNLVALTTGDDAAVDAQLDFLEGAGWQFSRQ